MAGTGIDAAAVIALAESLKTNTSLQSLDLSGAPPYPQRKTQQQLTTPGSA